MTTLKRLLRAMLVLVALTATVWAQNAHKSAIIGSAHDFTTYTWTSTATGATAEPVSTNLCFFCHVIHKTGAGIAGTHPGYMLWNHTLSSIAGGSSGTYGVYSSDTFNALLDQAGVSLPTDLSTTNTISSPTVSNLCLSCHDGTVAVASFYTSGFGMPSAGSSMTNSGGHTFTTISGGNPFQISDLSRTHPVNFAYTAALAGAAGGGLLSPASLNSVDGSGAVPLYGNAGLMECTTCHDPHNGAFLQVSNIPSGSTMTKVTTVFPFPRLLLATYTGTGGVCAYCHT